MSRFLIDNLHFAKFMPILLVKIFLRREPIYRKDLSKRLPLPLDLIQTFYPYALIFSLPLLDSDC